MHRSRLLQPAEAPAIGRAPGAGWIGTAALALLVAGCNGGGSPPATEVGNAAPAADGGSDLAVLAGASAALDGRGSSDPDGDRITWAWAITTRPAGSAAAFQPGTADDPQTSFTPDVSGTYVVELTVTDFAGAVDTDSVTVTATAPPPTANAGSDRGVQFAEPSTTVTLDGSASTDPSSLPLTYAWVIEDFVPASGLPPASPVSLAGASTAAPSFTVEALDQLGAYTISLTVDNGEASSTDEVVITVASVPPPVASAGPDQEVTFVVEGVTVNLDGTGSSDPSDLPLTYAWQITGFTPASGDPPAVPAALVGAATATPSLDITALDQLGTYTIQLTVNNGTLPATDTVVVEVAKTFPAAGGMLGAGLAALGAWAAGRWRSRRKAGGPREQNT